MTDPVDSPLTPVTSAGRPGRVRGAWPVERPDAGPNPGWRLSFDTKDERWRPTVGHGLLIVSAQPWPGGRSRPLVCVGDLTPLRLVGSDPVTCAGRVAARGVDLALARGWAVAVCELPIGGDDRAGAYALLDIARAAVHCGVGLAPDAPTLVWGHGLLAPAALRAAALQAEYAPELALAGVAASGHAIYTAEPALTSAVALGHALEPAFTRAAASGALGRRGPQPRPARRWPRPPVYLYRTLYPSSRDDLLAAASAIEWLADRLDPVPVW